MARIYIETNGCTHNQSDSEHMAGLLSQNGHQIVNNEESADLVLFNTCTVKTPTEHAFFNRLKEVEGKNKKIVVGGCIPQSDPGKFKNHSIIGTHQLEKINEIVIGTLNGETLSAVKRNSQNPLLLPKIRSNPLIEIITINTGCLGSCTFCKTKSARGNLASYPPEEIIKRAREATNEGVKEIWLTSQDTACYGFDKKTNVANLLKELCKINKDFKIRLGMGNPDHFIKITDELIEAMKDNKIYKFLHIPLQSGNNEVLKDMKREYTLEQYKIIIEKFKKAIPDITVATDIICGFPGETKDQFEDTARIIQETKPDIVNVSRYWARSKTLASRRKDQVPTKEIMQRSERLSKIAQKISLENKRKNIGKEFRILITESGKENLQWKGRTANYLETLVKGHLKIGQEIQVKITGATAHNLIGKKI